MDSQTNGQSVDTSGGQQAPAQPIPAPTQTTEVTPTNNPIAPMDSASGGGKDFLKNLDWVEVGLGALASLTLYFVIYYYKNKVIFERMEKSQIQKQLDIIKSDLEELKNNEINDANDGGGF
jgi:hypothetical protein